jgi:hypothetical protein
MALKRGTGVKKTLKVKYSVSPKKTSEYFMVDWCRSHSGQMLLSKAFFEELVGEIWRR